MLSAVRPVSHSEIVVCNKAPEKSDFSNDNSGSDAHHELQEGQSVCWPRSDIWNKLFLIEPHLLFINDLVWDLNLSKQAELLGSS
jgi:hypothetical protein